MPRPAERKKRKFDREAYRQRMRDKEQREKSTGTGTMLALPENVKLLDLKEAGVRKLDILPFVSELDNFVDEIPAGEEWYVATVYAHTGIGLKEKSYICPKETFGKPCPICDYIVKARKKGGHSQEELDALRPKHRELYAVIDRTEKGHKEEVKLLLISFFNFGKKLRTEVEEIEREEGDPKYRDYACLEGGYTLKCRFIQEAQGGFKFLKLDRVDFIERDDYDDAILDKVPDLLKCVKVYPYDELEKIFNCESDNEESIDSDRADHERKHRKRDDEDDEEEEETSSRKSRSKKDDDEDEEEEKSSRKSRSKRDDNDEDEEEEEEEKSSRRKKSSSKKDDDEEEEEEEDSDSEDEEEEEEEEEEEDEEEEEEEEEEKPSKSKRPSKKTEEDDEDEEEDDADRKPSKKQAASKKSEDSSKKSSDKCPFKHVFGSDCNKHDDCIECTSWDDCDDRRKELKGSKK